MVNQEVIDEIYAGVYFNNTLEDLGLSNYSLSMDDPVEDRVFVLGTAGSRNSPMYSSSDGMSLLCVYKVHNGDPPITEPQMVSQSDLVDEIPYAVSRSGKDSVPSLKGQYLQVMEWSGKTKSDGTDVLTSGTTTYWIPVEWVKKRVYYDSETTEYHP